MKNLKKAALLLVSVLGISVLGGCGGFDASAYTKALLDNSYKNDSTDFVDLKIGTAEEAAELYEQGLDNEINTMTSMVDLSDELLAEYREVYASIYANVRYTVGEAEKQDDGSYVVSVTYEQMQIFGPSVEAYTNEVTELINEWTESGEIPDTDEIYEQSFTILKDCLKENLDTVTYAEPQTTTIRIELNDNVYSPNQDDLVKLESVLFDMDAIGAM